MVVRDSVTLIPPLGLVLRFSISALDIVPLSSPILVAIARELLALIVAKLVGTEIMSQLLEVAIPILPSLLVVPKERVVGLVETSCLIVPNIGALWALSIMNLLLKVTLALVPTSSPKKHSLSEPTYPLTRTILLLLRRPILVKRPLLVSTE